MKILGIVVLVIVLLATIGWMAFTMLFPQRSHTSDKYSCAGTEIKIMASSVVFYRLHHGEYPARLEDIEMLPDTDPPPETDPWDRPYQYYVSEDEMRFQIVSEGISDETDEDDILWADGRIVNLRDRALLDN